MDRWMDGRKDRWMDAWIVASITSPGSYSILGSIVTSQCVQIFRVITVSCILPI